jgi:FixJ family two-component response regulator
MGLEAAIIYVVDDDARVRDALHSLLRSHGRQVHDFASAKDYLAYAGHDGSNSCVILDLDMPEMNGLELQQAIAEQEGPPIIFLTGHGDVPSAVKAMKAGASEFLTKPFDEVELMKAIDQALDAARVIGRDRAELRALQARYSTLTPRERDVLPYVVAGLLNKQTAGELGTSEITVRIHRGQIMRKMEAESLADLVRMATRLGIVMPRTPYTKR